MKIKFKGNDRKGHAKQLYLNELLVMSEKQLIKETGDQVFQCIFTIERPEFDCHWMLIACSDEWEARGRKSHGGRNLYLDVCTEIFDEEYGMEQYRALGVSYE